mmetsp:Transcript_27614/g.60007  ORF Transcript_27614/g.60007 Transcript_27614/m.60007 type:complete len:212 (+) Transcript_27614:248-883(+)
MQKLEESVRSGNARMLHPEATYYCPIDDGDADADDDSGSDSLTATTSDDDWIRCGQSSSANSRSVYNLDRTESCHNSRRCFLVGTAESGPDKVQSTLEVSAVNNHIRKYDCTLGADGEEEQDEVCKGKAACEDLLVKTSVNATSTSASTNVNATELTPAPAVADKIKNAGIENNADKVCTATDSDSATCNSGVKASVPQASSGVKVGSPVP